MFCYSSILSHPLFFYAYKELTINISFFYADLILTDDEKKISHCTISKNFCELEEVV